MRKRVLCFLLAMSFFSSNCGFSAIAEDSQPAPEVESQQEETPQEAIPLELVWNLFRYDGQSTPRFIFDYRDVNHIPYYYTLQPSEENAVSAEEIQELYQQFTLIYDFEAKQFQIVPNEDSDFQDRYQIRIDQLRPQDGEEALFEEHENARGEKYLTLTQAVEDIRPYPSDISIPVTIQEGKAIRDQDGNLMHQVQVTPGDGYKLQLENETGVRDTYIYNVYNGDQLTYYVKDRTDRDAPYYQASAELTYQTKYIIPFEVVIKDEARSKNYGEEKNSFSPDDFDLIAENPADQEKIPEELKNYITVAIHNADQISDYQLDISFNDVINQNYDDLEFMLNQVDQQQFQVREYYTSAQPTIQRVDEKGTVRIIAPENYQIRLTDQSQFRGSYRYHANNGTNTVDYYLKNIETGAETTTPQSITFDYDGIQPELQDHVLIETVSGNSIINFLTFGAFAKEQVKLSIWIRGNEKSNSAQPETIAVDLHSENMDQSVNAEIDSDPPFYDQYTYYRADFTIEADQETVKNMQFTASAKSEHFSEASEKSLLLCQDRNAITNNQTNVVIQADQLMIEQNPPVILKYNQANNRVLIQAEDLDSGLNYIQYRWGNSRKLHTQDLKGENPDHSVIKEEIEIPIKRGNKDTLYVQIVDNAGNVSQIQSTDEEGNQILIDGFTEIKLNVPDCDPPVIKEFSILDQNDKNAVNVYDYGVFSKTPPDQLKFVVSAYDPKHPNEPEEQSNSYHSVAVSFAGHAFKQITENPAFEENRYELTDLNYLKDSHVPLTIVASDGIPEHNEFYNFHEEPNFMIFDQKPPSVTFSSNAETSQAQKHDGDDWYGIRSRQQQESILIHLSDEISGIAKVAVKIANPDDENLNSPDLIYQDLTEYSINYISDYTEGQNLEKNQTIEIPIFAGNQFKDGAYSLKVFLTDNAGNTAIETYRFHIDTIRPELPNYQVEKNPGMLKDPATGNVIFADHSSDDQTVTIIDGYPWIVPESNADVNLYNMDDHPFAITWDVNHTGKAITQETDQLRINMDEIREKIGDQTEYDIQVKVTDMAGNTNYMNENGQEVIPETDYLLIRQDNSAPVVNAVTVSENSGFIDQLLNVLSFGIYSNNTIRITANVTDDYNNQNYELKEGAVITPPSVYIQLSAKGQYQPMIYDGNNQYHYDIPLNQEVVSGEIRIKAVDSYGTAFIHTYHQDDANIFDQKTKIILSDDMTNEQKEALKARWEKEKAYQIYLNHTNTTGNGTIENGFVNFPNIKDDQGTETASRFFMLEQKAPMITVDQPGSDGIQRPDMTTWYHSDKRITLDVIDPDSGIHQTELTVNGIKFDGDEFTAFRQNQNVRYTISTDTLIDLLSQRGQSPADGLYEIHIKAEDNAGNISEEYVNYYIDKTAPHVDLIHFSIQTADGLQNAAEFITILEYGFYFEQQVIANVELSDLPPSSGLYDIQYRLESYDTDESQAVIQIGEPLEGSATVENNIASFVIPANFKGRIYVTARDYTLNESEEVSPQSFVIDTPDRHNGETHVSAEIPQSEQSDSDHQNLYPDGTEFKAVISDSMSGISEFSYRVVSEKNPEPEFQTIKLENTGYVENQEIGDGWYISRMDYNLVTEVSKNYHFSEDDNNIQLEFNMTDRSYNTSSGSSQKFTVDQTPPQIQVRYHDDPSSSDHIYSNNRKAQIIISDRNLNPDDLADMIHVQNSYTDHIPAIQFHASDNNTVYTAELDFDEGDYTLEISGKDRAGHDAFVNYDGLHAQDFRVDKTGIQYQDENALDQALSGFYSSNGRNIFNAEKSLTIAFREHNFDPNRLNLHIYKVPSGETFQQSSSYDVAKSLLSNWSSNGDLHEATVHFENGFQYQVVIVGDDIPADACGNTLINATAKASPVFEIDTTPPTLSADIEPVSIYSGNPEQENPEKITFSDNNIRYVKYAMKIYKLIDSQMSVESTERLQKGGTATLGKKYFQNSPDGIYEITCTAYDDAQNASDPVTHTYVIQRNTDFLAYIPGMEEGTEIPGLYTTPDLKEKARAINSNIFPDIPIEAYILNDQKFSVMIDDQEVPQVTEENTVGLKIEEKDDTINEVTHYSAVLGKDYIAEHFSAERNPENDPAVTVMCSGVASTIAHIKIDNQKPTGKYDALNSKQNYYYTTKVIEIKEVSPDVDIDRCTIDLTVSQKGFGKEKIKKTVSGSDLEYIPAQNLIRFTLPEGYYDSIIATLWDYAENDYKMEAVEKIYIGSKVNRWKNVMLGSGLGVLGLIVFLVIRRRRSN